MYFRAYWGFINSLDKRTAYLPKSYVDYIQFFKSIHLMVENAGSTETEQCKSVDPNSVLTPQWIKFSSHNKLNGV